MTTAEAFSTFLDNIKVCSEQAKLIRNRYNEITKKLNKKFRDTDSETANSLRVGSYGRYTGIKGISDLDMLYIMPNILWETYADKPGSLLSDVKEALRDRYPKTKMRKDNLVVVVDFSDLKLKCNLCLNSLMMEKKLPPINILRLKMVVHIKSLNLGMNNKQ